MIAAEAAVRLLGPLAPLDPALREDLVFAQEFVALAGLPGFYAQAATARNMLRP